MLPFETERLVVRNWRGGDRAVFHEINSDPRVMEFFPFRRDRTASDQMMDRLAARIDADGFGLTAIELRETGECLGFTGLAEPGLEPILPGDAVEIGWRLAHRHWGKGFVTEAARAWLRVGFEQMGLDEIVSFAVADNKRSTAVMERLGLRHDPSRDFLHPRVPDDQPRLKPHVLYAITREQWQAQQDD